MYIHVYLTQLLNVNKKNLCKYKYLKHLIVLPAYLQTIKFKNDFNFFLIRFAHIGCNNVIKSSVFISIPPMRAMRASLCYCKTTLTTT